MARPPFWLDAVQETTDDPFAPPVTVTVAGALGTVAGVALAEAVELGEVPAELIA
jgi:hypothetical protein